MTDAAAQALSAASVGLLSIALYCLAAIGAAWLLGWLP